MTKWRVEKDKEEREPEFPWMVTNPDPDKETWWFATWPWAMEYVEKMEQSND